MKRFMMSLVLMVAIAASAAAMSFSKARKEALFLSDKMAYELSLSLSQYEAVYEINLDYMLGLRNRSDLDGVFWMRRNADLRYVLSTWQWDRYCMTPDFYRPMVWVSRHSFSLSLRTRYVNRHFFYYERPAIYGSYRGGHNAGNQSYYQGRDFHRPSTNVGPQYYGSSTPAPRGAGRPKGNKNQPSYSISQPTRGQQQGYQQSQQQSQQQGQQQGQQQSGSVRGRAGGTSSSRSQGSMSTGSRSSRSTTTTTTTTTTTSTSRSGSTRGNRGGR